MKIAIAQNQRCDIFDFQIKVTVLFKVENLGKIESATLDLSDDLIIFCGQNNTGKTFLSYTVYGLGEMINWKEEKIPYLLQQLDMLKTSGKTEIDLYKLILENKTSIERNASRNLIELLPSLIGAEKDTFADTKIAVFWENNDLIDEILEMPFRLSGFNLGNSSIKLSKESGSQILNLTLQKLVVNDTNEPAESPWIDAVHDSILEFLALPISSFNFFLTAERSGITVFGKELLSHRFRVSSELQSFDENNRKVITDYLNQRTNVYPKAIQDAITFQRSFDARRNKDKTLFNKLADEIESSLLQGTVTTDQNGDVLYSFNGKTISIQQAASTIKSMASLVFFLRYRARKGSTLFIDEPEINLHPDNQRLIARIIAKLVNAKIKVFLSTHSDYIIRELNNLLTLFKYQTQPRAVEIMERYHYLRSELINPDKISVYSFEHTQKQTVNVVKLNLIDSGINIESINRIINNQNIISQEIFYSLVENIEN